MQNRFDSYPESGKTLRDTQCENMVEYKYTITKEDINDCALGCFEGPVTLVETPEQSAEAINALKDEPVIGFDTESRPSFHKGEHHPIALIQLSTERHAYLFRINKLENFPDLSPLFSDPSIIKVGLGIRDEISTLEKNTAIKCISFVDLEKVARLLGFHQRGVRALGAFFLRLRISKAAQKSNWERADLTEQQIRYAATDAWICLEIYRSMFTGGFLPLPNFDDMFVVAETREKDKERPNARKRGRRACAK